MAPYKTAARRGTNREEIYATPAALNEVLATVVPGSLTTSFARARSAEAGESPFVFVYGLRRRRLPPKYDRYGPRIVGSVVGPAAEAVTIRLVPRAA